MLPDLRQREETPEPPTPSSEPLAPQDEYGYGDGWVRCERCGSKALRMYGNWGRPGAPRFHFFSCLEKSCLRRWAILKGEVTELGIW